MKSTLFAAALLSLPLLAVPSGCGHAIRGTTQTPAAPDRIADLDEFSDALNRFALLAPDDPKRESYRAVLQRFLVGHMRNSIGDRRHEEALSALEFAMALYEPRELRRPTPAPDLAATAHEVYRIAARRGAEQPSFLALAAEQQFGDEKTRARAVREWQALEQWVVGNGSFSSEPLLRHEELEQALEQVAAVFPSPFVVRRLADLYVARHGAAKSAAGMGEIGTAARRRAEITGYLLVRAHLRADDLDGAVTALDRIEIDAPTRKLRDLVAQARSPGRSARPLLALADQFVPEQGEAQLPPMFATQGWGIVQNLAFRAVRSHPKDPYAHVLLGRAFIQRGLIDAAISELRSAVALKEDIFDAWTRLAVLEQESLSRLAARDPDAARVRLERVEALHRRAAQLWKDRPIAPGLPQAYHGVAEGLYHAGRADEAEQLLERSLQIEAVPASLDLLGTIALKRERFDSAKRRYLALADLPLSDGLARLHWEARARVQLGEIARRQGDPDGSAQQLGVALRQLNELLSKSGLDAEEQADRYVERGRLLFQLGDTGLAMEDFRRAGDAAPWNASSFADPLLFLVSYGYYEEALSVYRRAMAQTDVEADLKLYFTLWITELALRQQREPDPDSISYLREFSGAQWPKSLARHALGELPYSALVQAAGDRGEKTEAHFYEALRLWRLGKSGDAKALMRRVIDSGMLSFFEYDMAQTYLAWGELPKSARVPLLGRRAAKPD